MKNKIIIIGNNFIGERKDSKIFLSTLILVLLIKNIILFNINFENKPLIENVMKTNKDKKKYSNKVRPK